MYHSFPDTFYNRVLEVLLSNIDSIEKSENPESILTNTLELLAHFLQLQKGRILLWDTNTSQLVVKYSYGLTDVDISKAKYEICEGITGNILDTGQPVLINNISEDANFLGKITHAELNSSPISYIAVPICYQNSILGVLAVECKHQEDGDMEENSQALKLVAEMFANIIHTYSLGDFSWE